jgi:uncharacterized protein (DUF2236 family)
MQLAHPLVAMGVHTHSSYMSDPFGRAERTFILGQMLTFGNIHTSHQAAHTINHLHKHVQGILPSAAGVHAQGTIYDARNPELLLWVQATLIDTILMMYPMFIGPLSHDEQEQYYQESKVMSHLLGLTDAHMPHTVDDLRHYVQEMSYSNQLAATPQARELVQQVLFPPVPALLRPLLEFHLFATSAMLPAPIRDIHGLEWGPKRQRAFEVFTASMRSTLPLLPPALRVLPITRKMMQKGAISSTGALALPGFVFH